MTKPAVALLLVTLITGIFCASPHAEAARSSDTSGPVNSVSLTPTLGGYFFAGSEHYQPALLYGVKLGYDIVGSSIADSLGLEATYNHFSTSSDNDSGSAQGNLFRIDATYPIFPRDKVVPFLALGMGGITISSSHSDTSPLLNYGAGVKYFYENYLALRMDARHLLVYDNINTRNNFEVSAGVSYYFGKERIKKPEPLPDQDRDGVPDDLDKCSNTPKGVKVDRYGCPADSDKDGVPDDQDKCPNTPFGVTVTPDGCPQNGKKNDKKPAAAVPANLPPTKIAATDGVTAVPEKGLKPAEKTDQPLPLATPAKIPLAEETATMAAPPAVVIPAPTAPVTVPARPSQTEAAAAEHVAAVPEKGSNPAEESGQPLPIAAPAAVPLAEETAVKATPPAVVFPAPVAKPVPAKRPSTKADAPGRVAATPEKGLQPADRSLPIAAPDQVTLTEEPAVTAAPPAVVIPAPTAPAAEAVPTRRRSTKTAATDNVTAAPDKGLQPAEKSDQAHPVAAPDQVTLTEETAATAAPPEVVTPAPTAPVAEAVPARPSQTEAAATERVTAAPEKRLQPAEKPGQALPIAAPDQVTLTEETAVKAAPPAVVSPAPPAPETAAVPAIAPAPTLPHLRTVQPAADVPATVPEQQAAAEHPDKPADLQRQTVKRKIVRKLTIEFEFNKFTVRPKYFRQLRELAALIKSNPDATAIIEGHTDSIGKKLYNRKLSRRRAETVRSSLIRFGAEAERISTEWYGSTSPVATNATSAGRQRNRRTVTVVTVTIMENANRK